MGYVFAMGVCYGCGKLFSFNPNKVPSFKPPKDGSTRHPICKECVARVNPKREKNGVPPIVPLPGAYEEADESEIVWD